MNELLSFFGLKAASSSVVPEQVAKDASSTTTSQGRKISSLLPQDAARSELQAIKTRVQSMLPPEKGEGLLGEQPQFVTLEHVQLAPSSLDSYATRQQFRAKEQQQSARHLQQLIEDAYPVTRENSENYRKQITEIKGRLERYLASQEENETTAKGRNQISARKLHGFLEELHAAYLEEKERRKALPGVSPAAETQIDLLDKEESLINTGLNSDFDLSSYPESPASTSSPALSHQALQLPHHDQDEIPGLEEEKLPDSPPTKTNEENIQVLEAELVEPQEDQNSLSGLPDQTSPLPLDDRHEISQLRILLSHATPDVLPVEWERKLQAVEEIVGSNVSLSAKVIEVINFITAVQTELLEPARQELSQASENSRTTLQGKVNTIEKIIAQVRSALAQFVERKEKELRSTFSREETGARAATSLFLGSRRPSVPKSSRLTQQALATLLIQKGDSNTQGTSNSEILEERWIKLLDVSSGKGTVKREVIRKELAQLQSAAAELTTLTAQDRGYVNVKINAAMDFFKESSP